MFENIVLVLCENLPCVSTLWEIVPLVALQNVKPYFAICCFILCEMLLNEAATSIISVRC